MKELSIEEKAKAYDGNYKTYTELINRLEDVKNAIKKQNYGIAMDILCKPYPEYQITISIEFEESEDERIRKDIISFVEQAIDAGYGIISKERKEKWIAWLEKRGKNSMGISEATKQKLEDNLHEALEKETPESCNKFLNEQGEQKSMKTCAEYYNQDNELKMPELSEFQNKLADILMYREYDGPDETEDDIARGRLEYELAAIRLSEELLPLAQKEQKPADTEKGAKWNDREIPNSAWSEEDEHNLNSVINLVHNTRDGAWGSCVGERIESWLKVLKDRCTWKPSDEQIKALDSAIHCYAGISPTNNREVYALEIMKEQLKKLMEKDV